MIVQINEVRNWTSAAKCYQGMVLSCSLSPCLSAFLRNRLVIRTLKENSLDSQENAPTECRSKHSSTLRHQISSDLFASSADDNGVKFNALRLRCGSVLRSGQRTILGN